MPSGLNIYDNRGLLRFSADDTDYYVHVTSNREVRNHVPSASYTISPTLPGFPGQTLTGSSQLRSFTLPAIGRGDLVLARILNPYGSSDYWMGTLYSSFSSLITGFPVGSFSINVAITSNPIFTDLPAGAVVRVLILRPNPSSSSSVGLRIRRANGTISLAAGHPITTFLGAMALNRSVTTSGSLLGYVQLYPIKSMRVVSSRSGNTGINTFYATGIRSRRLSVFPLRFSYSFTEKRVFRTVGSFLAFFVGFTYSSTTSSNIQHLVARGPDDYGTRDSYGLQIRDTGGNPIYNSNWSLVRIISSININSASGSMFIPGWGPGYVGAFYTWLHVARPSGANNIGITVTASGLNAVVSWVRAATGTVILCGLRI